MKKFLKSTFFIASLFLLNSCENDKEFIASPQGFTLTKDPKELSPSTLIEADKASNYGKFVWEEANYGVQTSSSYKLFINDADADPTATNSIEIPSTFNVEGNTISTMVNIEKFNVALNSLPSFKCGLMSINFRVKSILGDANSNFISQDSSPVNVKVTAYTLKIPSLAFSKSISDIKTSSKLVSLGLLNKEYEGYVYLTAGNYKFYQPDPCGDFTTPTVYGGPGLTGALSTIGSDIVIANTGHYLIKADLVANTYSIKEFRTFGVFGGGVRIAQTGNAAPMTDALNNNVWKLTVELITGEKFRFKSNLWTGTAITPNIINVPNAAGVSIPMQFPPFIPPAGTTTISILGKNATAGQAEEVSGTAGEISVPGTIVDKTTRKKFDIVLDVSKPRNYTYTITENNN